MFSVDDLDFNLDNYEENEENIAQAVPQSPSIGNSSKDVFRIPAQMQSKISSVEESICDDFELKNTRKCVKRKFPGPAGLLPDMPPRSFNDSFTHFEKAEEESESKRHEVPMLCSQNSENLFLDPPFKKLKIDFDLDGGGSQLNLYTLEWVKKKALSKGLKGRKIPFLTVILQNVDRSSADPILSLRDPTGELSAALHREAWQELGSQLTPGAAIVLKQVGVLSTGVSRRQVLLNITMNNIVTIYSPCEESEGEVIVKSVHPTTTSDLIKSIADWQSRTNDSPARSTLSSPKTDVQLFQSVTLQRRITPQNCLTNLSPVGISTNNDKVGATEKANSQVSNFDLFMDDDDDIVQLENAFISQSSQICETPIAKARPVFTCKKTGNSKKIVMSDADSVHKTEFKIPVTSKPNVNYKYAICSQTALSQAEALQIDEVLSGVDLDEFD